MRRPTRPGQGDCDPHCIRETRPAAVPMRFVWALVFCSLISLGILPTKYSSRTVFAAENSLDSPRTDFAGSAACAECHTAQSIAWTNSQHAHAMQAASEATVLGDFLDAQAEHFSSKARFYRKEGRFFAGTEGKDG